ncbi:MAG: hypothetical protein MO846_12435 [Candidatus Devosia symbiotica]|nr:hypothetical protein [Candidatus Devosia symbiotica]
MSKALALIRVVLSDAYIDTSQARHLLAVALEAEIDPLIHCAIACDISETLAMQRAAAWASCVF